MGGATPGGASSDAELTTLDPVGNPLPDCVEAINPTPFVFMSSAGAALIGTGSLHLKSVYIDAI